MLVGVRICDDAGRRVLRFLDYMDEFVRKANEKEAPVVQP